ncbi:hypothetical protein ACQ4PT_009169 [Festuca glaucescens]
MVPNPAEAPARASSSRKPKPPKMFADKVLAVASKRPRSKAASASGKKPTKANAVRKARRTTAPTSRKKKNAAAAEDDDDQCADEPDQDALAEDEAEELAALLAEGAPDEEPAQHKRRNRVAAKAWEEGDPEFVGDPVPSEEARATFPKRYQPVAAAAPKRKGKEEEEIKARRHYSAAKVEEIVYNIGDDVYVTVVVIPSLNRSNGRDLVGKKIHGNPLTIFGKYALSRLVAMKYQSRLGIMVAGCYRLPQFRMRVFLWGALSTMVGNDQYDDIIEYLEEPKTEFQRYIRLTRREMLDFSFGDQAGPGEGKLLDHRPLKLNTDDYEWVKKIPYKKGANFRDLEGVKVGPNNVVEFDPNVPRVYLESSKPLVPNYAMKFVGGKSLKPFGRLWGCDTVSTVVTGAEPHNQAVLHPSQARVLTVRENARLQGFPDYYRMDGPIKQRYMQIGNAVAVPVARALGYSLGLAYLGKHDGSSDPLFKLPANFFSPGQTEGVVRASSVELPIGEVAEQ